MAKSRNQKSLHQVAPPLDAQSAAATADAQIVTSNLTLHELFQQQTTALLECADLGDEEKQRILVAMSCPCCGAGGFSLTAKLNRRR
jgi:hypothetical protein